MIKNINTCILLAFITILLPLPIQSFIAENTESSNIQILTPEQLESIVDIAQDLIPHNAQPLEICDDRQEEYQAPQPLLTPQTEQELAQDHYNLIIQQLQDLEFQEEKNLILENSILEAEQAIQQLFKDLENQTNQLSEQLFLSNINHDLNQIDQLLLQQEQLILTIQNIHEQNKQSFMNDFSIKEQANNTQETLLKEQVSLYEHLLNNTPTEQEAKSSSQENEHQLIQIKIKKIEEKLYQEQQAEQQRTSQALEYVTKQFFMINNNINQLKSSEIYVHNILQSNDSNLTCMLQNRLTIIEELDCKFAIFQQKIITFIESLQAAKTSEPDRPNKSESDQINSISSKAELNNQEIIDAQENDYSKKSWRKNKKLKKIKKSKHKKT